MERGWTRSARSRGGVRVASDAPALGTRAFPLRRRPERGKVHGRARACHASSRVATGARWGATTTMSLLGNAARARALRDGDRGEADVARSAPLFAVDRSRASRTRESAGPGRARACARRRPRQLLDPSVKVRKRFTGATHGSVRARSFLRASVYGGFSKWESRLSREARASRVEPAAREAETCRTCEYCARARRGPPSREPRFGPRRASPARLEPLPPSAQQAGISPPRRAR